MGFVYRDDFLDCDCLPDCQIPWTRISFPKEIRLCASLRARFDFSLIFQGRKLKLNFDNHSGRKPRVNQINFQLNNHVEEEKWSYNTFFLSQSNVVHYLFSFLGVSCSSRLTWTSCKYIKQLKHILCSFDVRWRQSEVISILQQLSECPFCLEQRLLKNFSCNNK